MFLELLVEGLGLNTTNTLIRFNPNHVTAIYDYANKTILFCQGSRFVILEDHTTVTNKWQAALLAAQTALNTLQ